MPVHDLSPWQHSHRFLDARAADHQRRTEWVAILTLVTMVIELVFGYLTGSMALLADGWHMGSHVAALGIAAFAYRYARRQSDNSRFTFGTGKVGALGGYTSAVFLVLMALPMTWESLLRLWQPQAVAYDEALGIAVLGLLVNMASAWLLGGHAHDHVHDKTGRPPQAPAVQAHHDRQAGHDHNLEGAFMHVLADMLTSVLAIAALLGGRHFGWRALDPLMGLVGAGLIFAWGARLIRAAGRTLLDAEDHSELRRAIVAAIEAYPDHKVVDLHVWRLGPDACGCIVSILSHTPATTETYKRALLALPGIAHVSVEINRCPCPESLG
jgi:cation diffusion facilitator family transporter